VIRAQASGETSATSSAHRDGRITHVTAINARWLLDQNGELVATLRDGRQLRIGRHDVSTLLD
jgi:hypothetical protein